jgi:two-component system sensor histidine kinase AtoS
MAQSRELELTFTSDKSIPHTMLDVDIIHDAILNLVNNAIDATAEIGSKVEIVTRCDTENACQHVVISDDGPGIPLNICSRIFEPFFSTKGSKGSGLGLAIVKKAIEEHGGKILLDTEEGHGTTFTITLPIVLPEKNDNEEANNDN